MKKLAFLLLFVSNSLVGQDYSNINLFDYVGKSVDSKIVQDLIKDWTFEEYELQYFCDYNNGLSIGIDDAENNISSLFVSYISDDFRPYNGNVPYGLTQDNSFDELKLILGDPDELLSWSDTLISIHRYKWSNKGILVYFDYDEFQSGREVIKSIQITEPR